MKRLIRGCVLLLAFGAIAAPALPPQFHAPAGFAVSGVRYVQFDTAKFEYLLAGKTERVNIEGHVWQLYLGSDTRPVADPAVTSTKIAAALEHDGWTILRHDGLLVAKNGDLWMTGYGNSGSVKVTPSNHAETAKRDGRERCRQRQFPVARAVSRREIEIDTTFRPANRHHCTARERNVLCRPHRHEVLRGARRRFAV